jgi:hypothetical protein
MRRPACEFVCSTLARMQREGHETVTGESLLAELRRFDPQFDPASLGFGDLGGLLRAVRARFDSEPDGEDVLIQTALAPEASGATEGSEVPPTPEEYQSLLSRLQLRVTPVSWRKRVVERIYESIHEASSAAQPITAGEIESDLMAEFAQTGEEGYQDAVRDTLRVLFVNRAFRLESVDDGYDSPLTFNKLYIRTAEDLQLYYAEAILCAIKNMIRERGGGRPDIRVLAELILGAREAVSDLETIEAQLQGADRPFKKPPRYTGRWASAPPAAESDGDALTEPAQSAPGSRTGP